MSRFISAIFGRSQQYNPLPNTNSAMLPGAFPGEEPIAPNSGRNSTNSSSMNHFFQIVLYWINYLLIKPIIIFIIISLRILTKFLNIIYFKDQNYQSPPISVTENGAPVPNNHSNDPIDKVNRFVRDLEDNLTAEQILSEGEYLPPFYQGSYTQALYMTTNRAKFLFVYLTNPHNESSSTLFKKVITNPDFINLFKSKDIIIWGGDLTNPEAYQLANSLNVTKFPFLGLLCLTRTTKMSPQGPIKTSPKISLISKIQGGFSEDVDVRVLIQNKFRKKIGKYEQELSSIRSELRDTFLNQVLLKQQELNYQESLAKDRAKKLAKQREHLRKQYLLYRADYFRQLKADKNAAGKAKIAIKFTSGIRTTFLFPAESKVDDIFMLVELINRGYLEDDSAITTISTEEAESKFKDFTMDYKFKLTSPLPPRTSLNDVIDCQIKDVGVVYPNGVLIVEDL
ncbi:predicted protein [Scheffersomyces stipitis CBS 6054]|uniref:UBX domain-containing protein n=1 Tax=Scheffersomyces stipitis (strain ATCC 58785 / CBS 6054 / NBRC 10063 / NRRL Y-11545) TaxID=322104 RepID=A3LS54_PICST|nr:predicted protein [Scheffersomyces stipitis CBS 6054]ABN65505.2 predicted protein [Scheffersomyces stipitis CBS 6054]KAG2733812.1 hypothetical protein G9P44_003337 [Scheffersomyces stipitis]